MADRNIDSPSEQGLKGRFKRGTSGLIGKESLPALYVDELGGWFRPDAKGNRMELNEYALVGMMSTALGLVGVMGGMGVGGLTYAVMDEDAAVDARIVQGLGGEYGYQSVRYNDATYALVRQGDQYHVYRQSGNRLHYVDGVGDALEVVRNVTSSLQSAATALENSQIPEGDLVDFVRYSNLSEAFVETNGTIQRRFDAAQGDKSANAAFLPRLQEAAAQWQQAGQSMARAAYGYTQDQQQALMHDGNVDPYMAKTIPIGAVIGFLGIPFGLPLVSALGRRKKIKQERRANKP